MAKIKNKNKQAPRRKWKLAFGCLLALVLVPLASFWAWYSFCEIPKVLPAVEDFKQLVSSNDRSELEVIQRLYYGISRQMAWRGTADYISPGTLEYRCSSDSCKLTRADVMIGVSAFKICWHERRINGIIFEADIRGIDRGNPRIKLDIWRPAYSGAVDRELLFTNLTSDVTAIKEYALTNVGERAWRIHSILNIKLMNWNGSWEVEVATLYPDNEKIYHARVYPSEYRDHSEQKQ